MIGVPRVTSTRDNKQKLVLDDLYVLSLSTHIITKIRTKIIQTNGKSTNDNMSDGISCDAVSPSIEDIVIAGTAATSGVVMMLVGSMVLVTPHDRK